MVNDQVYYTCTCVGYYSLPLYVCVCVQVAGYVTEYEENNFKFVTVKGSGHMVTYYT